MFNWYLFLFFKIRNNEHPSHWPTGLKSKSFQKIKVAPHIFNQIANHFRETMDIDVNIASIEEVCNIDIYDRYARLLYYLFKKSRMNYERKLPCKIILNNEPEKSRGTKGVYIARRTKNFEKKVEFESFLAFSRKNE